jgi:hypothetical protein
MDSILKGALSDPVLFHALSLVLTLAANANVPNVEALTYRGEALKHMQVAMVDRRWKPTVSAITAMLMLIGYEYRIKGGDGGSISTHVRGVQVVMNMYQAENVAIVGQIRRALFWQHLLSCFVLGTLRLLSHEMYDDWKWPRYKEPQSRCTTPDGFSGLALGWLLEFAIILQDLTMLCTAVDTCAISGDTFFVDDAQANLESQSVDLLNASCVSCSSADSIYEACIYATYLCIYKLSIGIWNSCFIPEVCVDRILLRLANTAQDPRWTLSPSLLLWLLFVLGGLTERSSIKQRVKALIESAFSTRSRRYTSNEFL